MDRVTIRLISGWGLSNDHYLSIEPFWLRIGENSFSNDLIWSTESGIISKSPIDLTRVISGLFCCSMCRVCSTEYSGKYFLIELVWYQHHPCKLSFSSFRSWLKDLPPLLWNCIFSSHSVYSFQIILETFELLSQLHRILTWGRSEAEQKVTESRYDLHPTLPGGSSFPLPAPLVSAQMEDMRTILGCLWLPSAENSMAREVPSEPQQQLHALWRCSDQWGSLEWETGWFYYSQISLPKHSFFYKFGVETE